MNIHVATKLSLAYLNASLPLGGRAIGLGGSVEARGVLSRRNGGLSFFKWGDNSHSINPVYP
jgi:hypothetical protein